MDPWGNAAAQYNQGLGQLQQINQQGYQAQAQGPASIYDRFLQGYVQAKQMRMQEEAAKREQQNRDRQTLLAEETLRHNRQLEVAAAARLAQQDSIAEKERKMKFFHSEVDPNFTGDPQAVQSFVKQAVMSGIPEPEAVEYFNSRKIQAKPANELQNTLVGEGMWQPGAAGAEIGSPETYIPGTQYSIKKQAQDEANRAHVEGERYKAQGLAIQGATQAEVARHNRAMESAALAKLSQGDKNQRLDPEDVQNLAKRLVQGIEPWPTGRVATDPDYKEALALARKMDPTFNADTSKIRMKTQEAFTRGKQGDANNAFNTAIGHLDRWLNSVSRIKNPEVAVFGKAKVNSLRQLGDADVLAADSDTNTLANELERAYVLAGGTEAGREMFRKNLGSHLGPKGAAATAKEIAGLLASKLESNQKQYQQGMNGFGNIDFLTPESQQVLRKLGIVASSKTGEPSPATPSGGNDPLIGQKTKHPSGTKLKDGRTITVDASGIITEVK